MIAVTPVFSASYSGLFMSFFDVLDPQALVGTPVLMAATGGSAKIMTAPCSADSREAESYQGSHAAVTGGPPDMSDTAALVPRLQAARPRQV